MPLAPTRYSPDTEEGGGLAQKLSYIERRIQYSSNTGKTFMAHRGIRERLRRLLDRDSEDGQGMVEYALILVLIAVVVIVVLIVLGGQVQNVFSDIVSGLGT